MSFRLNPAKAIRDTFSKGKEAQEGEIRDWKGKKFQKRGGKWEEVVDGKGKKGAEEASGSKKKSGDDSKKSSGATPPSIDNHEIGQMTHMKSIMDSDPDKAYEIYQNLSPEAQAKVPQDAVNKLVSNSHAEKDDGVNFDDLGKKESSKKEGEKPKVKEKKSDSKANAAKKALGLDTPEKLKKELASTDKRIGDLEKDLKEAKEDGIDYMIKPTERFIKELKDHKSNLEKEIKESGKEKGKEAGEGKTISGDKLTDPQKKKLLEGMVDTTSRANMRAMIGSDKYEFTIKTSQFGNNTLIITNNTDGREVYSGADSKFADKLVALGIPHGGDQYPKEEIKKAEKILGL